MLNISEKIYQTLTKRKYNRGKPFLSDEILKIINTSILNEQSIKLIGFWGVGSKSKSNWADKESCNFLSELNDEIKQIYKPGIEFIFIFAIMHGIHNGYDEKSINSYVEDMKNIFTKYDFKFLLLNNLWDKYKISFQKIDSIFQTEPKDWWLNVEEKDLIERNALQRNIKYSPEIAAQKYYIMRNLEKEMLEKEFKGYIFHAFSDSKLKEVLPNMPTLYFYSRESWSNTPWFVNSEKKDF